MLSLLLSLSDPAEGLFVPETRLDGGERPKPQP